MSKRNSRLRSESTASLHRNSSEAAAAWLEIMSDDATMKTTRRCATTSPSIGRSGILLSCPAEARHYVRPLLGVFVPSWLHFVFSCFRGLQKRRAQMDPPYEAIRLESG